MHLTLLVVGKSKTTYLDSAIAEYEKRLRRWTRIEWKYVPTSNTLTESKRIIESVDQDNFMILLDERGSQLSTVEFAQQIDRLSTTSVKKLCFVIGGAHGVSGELRERADFILSMSHMVFPHEQVRLMLLEQLYRVYDYNAGGKYHHA